MSKQLLLIIIFCLIIFGLINIPKKNIKNLNKDIIENLISSNDTVTNLVGFSIPDKIKLRNGRTIYPQKSFNWNDNNNWYGYSILNTTVYNQNPCGSCYAFASTSLA